jgi:DNA-binding MarR family transcriptional regulator
MSTYTALFRSYQLINAQVNQVMRAHGLTFARYEVLLWLATDPEEPLTLSWISRTLRVPPATVTNIIDYLETEKLLRRVTLASDARTTVAEITAAGRRLAKDVTQDLNTAVYEQVPLSEDKRALLIELLRELRANGHEFDVQRSEEVVDDLRDRLADA